MDNNQLHRSVCNFELIFKEKWLALRKFSKNLATKIP